MRSIGAYEAKTHLSRLLDEVERGKAFQITRRGRVIARLVPESVGTDAQTRKAVDELKAFRRKTRSLSLKKAMSAVHEGHRY